MSAITKRPTLLKITIEKTSGGVYTYDPLGGTFDFRLSSARIKPAHDSSGGEFEFKIVSGDVTNAAANTILSNIEEDNEVTIWIGKTSALLTKIFLGKIQSIETEEPNKDLMYINISGPDWGSDILKNLTTNRSWIQKKQVANQDLLDATDFDTTIGQVTLDLLTDPKSYPDKNYPVTAEDLGVIVTSGNYQDPTTSYQIPQFESNMESIDDKLTELDELGGTTHHVDQDKTFFQKPSDSFSLSGVLLTDDENDSEINPTFLGKVGFVEPNAKIKNTVETRKARIYGVGSSTFAKDVLQETTDDKSSLTSTWIAQRFTPTKQDAYTIAVYVGYSGTPAVDLTMLLVEDKNNTPTGSTIRSLSVNYTALKTGGGWYYFPINSKLTIGNNYWIVLAGNFAGNSYEWYHDNTDNSPAISATSSDGLSWSLTTTPNRFNYAFVYHSNDLLVVTHPSGVTSSTKNLHDEVIHRPDITDGNFMLDYLKALFGRIGKRKQIFSGTVYSPDQPLLPNQIIRIRKQQSGRVIDGFFILGEFEYMFESEEAQVTGQVHIPIEATRFIAYP